MHFSDLIKSPEDKQKEQLEARQFLASINNPAEWLYGSIARDRYLLHNNSSLPRYGHLARKAFVHYAKERYNPHTISITNEIHIRQLIMLTIEAKVFRRIKDYDWDALDNYFAKAIGNILDIDIPYDQARLDQGIREDLKTPLFYAKEATA